MNQIIDREPTLTDVLTEISNLKDDVGNLKQDVAKSNELTTRFDQRFSDYQKATQWVVQLAFTLIASATLTVIITSVFKR
jgi:hypothetical protein